MTLLRDISRPSAAGAVLVFAVAASALAQGGTIRCNLDFHVVPGEGTKKVEVTALVPHTIPRRQKVVSIAFSQEPARQFEHNGSSYAVFAIPEPKQPVVLSITADLQLQAPKAGPLPDKAAEGSRTAFEPWLASEKFVEADDPAIRDAAKAAKGTSDEDVARELAKFVVGHLSYTGYAADAKGAAAALRGKGGDCTEYADLLAALCRVRGLPARVCCGYTTEWEVVPCHNWVEVYLKGKGWVLFDPSQARFGINLLHGPKPVYVHLSAVRHDEKLDGYSFFSYRAEGTPPKVTSGFSVTVKGKTRTWRQ